MRYRQLREACRAIAAGGPQEAPSRIESGLLKAFRRRRRAAWWRRCGAAAGAIAAAWCGWWWVGGYAAKPVVKIAAPPAVVAVPHAPQIQVAAAQHTGARVPKRPRRDAATSAVEPPVYQLPGAEALSPLDFGTVVRVQLPRNDLTALGLPLSNRAPDQIDAEVLIGQDGLARAIRILN